MSWREPNFGTRIKQAQVAKGRFKPDAPVHDELRAKYDPRLVQEYMQREMRAFELKVMFAEPMFIDPPMLLRDRVAKAERLAPARPYEAPISRGVTVQEAIELAHKAAALAQAMRDFCGYSRHDVEYSPLDTAMTALMDSKGWNKAGAGHFALVYTKADLAIKVGTKSEDSGAAYAAWARDNQELPGVPKIWDIHRAGPAGFSVVMPKYYSTGHCGHARDLPNWYTVCRTADRIVGYFKGVARIDLHGANVMKDFEGNLIITDPVSFTPEGCAKVGLKLE